MTYLARIAERVINRPLFLLPQKADVILWVLGERIGVTAPAPEDNRFIGEPKRIAGRRGYGVTDGAAVITIEGSLVNRGDWIGADSGLVAYEGIEAQISTALADKNVQAIVLDIDSPGGEATGMYALAAKIRSARAAKPVVALVNDLAASAAYGIASQADEILVSPTSVVGSIGVVLLHVDRSKEMEMKGQTPTLIYAGARKVDGNPFAPLPDSVRADLQRDVMTFYDRFVETVVAGRSGRLSEAAARATEARTFIGQEAIDAGLADRMGGIAEAIALAARMAAERRVSMGEGTGRPNGTNEPPAPVAGLTPERNAMNWQEITAESLRQNRPDLVSAIEAAHNITAPLATARAEGARAEGERIGGILAKAKLAPGNDAVVAEMIADGKTTPDQAASRLLEAAAATNARQLQALKDADRLVAVPGAPLPTAAAAAEAPKYEQNEAGWKAEYAASPDLQREFASVNTYVNLMKAEHGKPARSISRAA